MTRKQCTQCYFGHPPQQSQKLVMTFSLPNPFIKAESLGIIFSEFIKMIIEAIKP